MIVECDELPKPRVQSFIIEVGNYRYNDVLQLLIVDRIILHTKESVKLLIRNIQRAKTMNFISLTKKSIHLTE